MSKHTPGPWRTMPEECDKPYIRIRGANLGGRYKVANVLTPVYDGAHQRESEETRANARLIAAAPDMLLALIMVIDTIGFQFMEQQIQDMVSGAIAKATGATHD